VAAAEQQGLTLTVGYVYNIRAAAKKNGAVVAMPTQGVASSSGIEAQLRTLVVRIGLDRAERILAEIKAAFSSAEGPSPRRQRRAAQTDSSTSSESVDPSGSSAPASA
jgi:hypothetical protein